MELTPENVNALAGICLAEGDTERRLLHVFPEEGAGPFDDEKVKEHAAEIESLLAQLPEDFMDDSEGQGATFLCACTDRDGRQWGEQKDAVTLFALGVAAGRVSCLLPYGM